MHATSASHVLLPVARIPTEEDVAAAREAEAAARALQADLERMVSSYKALLDAADRAEDRLTRTARDEHDLDALRSLRAAINRSKEVLA